MVVFVVFVEAKVVVVVTRPMLVSIVVSVGVMVSPELVLDAPGVSTVQFRDLLNPRVDQV